MTLEKQVCSLELAKRLKELGVKQKSLFYWKHNTESPYGSIDEWVLVHYGEPYITDSVYHIAAFTVAELGEMLPGKLPGRYCWRGNKTSKVGAYEVKYRRLIGGKLDVLRIEWAPTEADARAKMLIHLLEQKLI